MSDKTDTLCWLCKKRLVEKTAGIRGYSTSLCSDCKSKLNGSVGVDPFETSRPLSKIEYEQRGRIAELERELAAKDAALERVCKEATLCGCPDREWVGCEKEGRVDDGQCAACWKKWAGEK